MTIESTLPFGWLKTLPAEIKSLDEIPLWGSPPPFPWSVFSEELSKALHIEHLNLIPSDIAWIPQNEISSNFGENPCVFEFTVAPLQGKAYLFFAREHLKKLFTMTVGSSADLPESDQNEFQKEFSHFLILEALQAYQKAKFDPSLTPQLIDGEALPQTTCLCLNVDIHTPQTDFAARLAFTPELRQSLRQKYAAKTLAYPKGLSASVSVFVNIVAGQVQLSKTEWNETTLGDVIILDSCSLVPGEDKGRIMLSVNGKPIFRGKIKDGNIKILEYPLLQEVQTSMANKEEEFEDESLHSEHEESELEGEEEEFEETTEEEEEEIPEEEPSDVTLPEDVTSEEEIEEDEDEELAEEESVHPKGAVSKAPVQSLVKPDEIPLTISVEVGRLQMSVQKLMDLQPGNILELDVHPENGVDLVVNGRCIGKGELLKLGDALGVRILDKA